MKDDKQLSEFIALCKRIYERMEAEGSWPWRDSPKEDDLVDSEDKQKDI